MDTYLDEGFKLVIVSSLDEEAEQLANTIIKEKLCACVSILPSAKSIYWWNETIETATESVLLIKTINPKIPKLISKIKELHSYDIPEILVVDIVNGNPDYFKWITGALSK